MPAQLVFFYIFLLISQVLASHKVHIHPSGDLPGEEVVFFPTRFVSDVVQAPIAMPPCPKIFLPFPNVGLDGCSQAGCSVRNKHLPYIDAQCYNYCKYYTMQALKRPEKFPNYFLDLKRDPKAKLIPATTYLDWFLEALEKCFSYKRSVVFEDFWYFIRKRPDFADISQQQVVNFFVKMTAKGIIFMPAVKSLLALHPTGLLQQHQFDLYLALRYFAFYVKFDNESLKREFNSLVDCLALFMKLYPEPVLVNRILQFVGSADPTFHHPFSLALKLAPIIRLLWGFESDFDKIDKYCKEAFHFIEGSAFRIVTMPQLLGLNQLLGRAFDNLSLKPLEYIEIFMPTLTKLVYNFFDPSVFVHSLDFVLSQHLIYIFDAILYVESDSGENLLIPLVDFLKIAVKYLEVKFLAVSNFFAYFKVNLDEVREFKTELLAAGWSDEDFEILEAFIAAIEVIPIHSAYMITFEPTAEFLACYQEMTSIWAHMHLEIGRVFLTRQQLHPFSSFRVLPDIEETNWIDMIYYINFFLERVTSNVAYDVVVFDDSDKNEPYQSGKASLRQIRSFHAETHYHSDTFYTGEPIPSRVLGIDDYICPQV